MHPRVQARAHLLKQFRILAPFLPPVDAFQVSNFIGYNYHEEEGDPAEAAPRLYAAHLIIISCCNQYFMVFFIFKVKCRYICKVTMVAAQTLDSGPESRVCAKPSWSLCRSLYHSESILI